MGDYPDVDAADLFQWSGGEPLECPDKPLGAVLLDSMRRNADAIDGPAQVDGATGASKTHVEVLRESVRAAAGWRALGLRADDAVAVFTRNNHHEYAAVLGAVLEGITLMTLAPSANEDEVRPLLARVAVKAILCDPDNVQVALKVAPDGVPVFVAAERSPVASTRTVGELLRGGAGQDVAAYRAAAVADPHRHVAAIMHSSGTSGLPKGVACSNRGLLLNALIGAWGLVVGDVMLLTSPVSWATGLMYTFISIMLGVTRVFLNYTDERACLDVILKYKTSMAFMAPGRYVLLAGLVKRLREQGVRIDLAHWRAALVGGAAMTGELQRTCTELLGVPVVQIFGCTEHMLIGGDEAGAAGPRYGSVGKLAPGVRARLVDTRTGRDIRAANAEGEIRLKSPHYMLGYVADPEKTAAAVDEHGWYCTGDLGRFDEQGNLFITDRIKEILKYMNLEVAPAEVENVLMSHPAVRNACVVGRHHPLVGDVPTAFVALFPGMRATEQELQEHVSARLSQNKRLRGGVFFLDEIPASSNGKTDRNVLRKRLSQLPPVSDSVLGLSTA